MSVKQTFTFISRSPAYASQRASLCLEAALAAAVFEQEIHYVFMDDGVLQLLTDQNSQAIGQKTLSKLLETLPLYGVENIYVDTQALAKHALDSADLVLDAQPIDDSQLAALIARSDQVLNL